MNPTPLAVTWIAGGLVAAAILPRLRRRRLAAAVPLLAAVVALLTVGGGADLSAVAAPGGLELGRAASGMAVISALATTIAVILSPPPDAGDIFVIGACGALSVVALAAGSPIVWGVSLVAGVALLGIRRLAADPSRATLAAGRVGPLGAAALVAAAPFLPIDETALVPRMHLVAALLGGGVAAGMGLLPVGGWMVAGARGPRGTALAPWVLLLLPALVLTAEPIQVELPGAGRPLFGGVLIGFGALTAVWASVTALVAGDGERYPRVLAADLGLVALGLATQDNGARLGGLLLLLTHVVIAPLALQPPSGALARPRRLAWLALSGVPPSPAFWGRFGLTTGAAAAFGATSLLLTVSVAGALLAVSLRAIADAPAAPGNGGAAVPLRALRFAAWLAPLAALTLGLLPGTSVRALLGVG